MTEAVSPRRQLVRIETDGIGGNEEASGWRKVFLEHLAETSNVAASAESAGISASLAYRTRRNDTAFAHAWRASLLEGYEHLELETLRRLRMGTDKDDPKFDIANALRILSLHKETVARERAGSEQRDEEAILASIDAKLERMRAREDNVARMLDEDGVSAPRLPGDDE